MSGLPVMNVWAYFGVTRLNDATRPPRYGREDNSSKRKVPHAAAPPVALRAETRAIEAKGQAASMLTSLGYV
ncbi:MAG: hypothetical protein IIB67_04905 [Proteobacteria bacterium]|nr:hypothetical protein [Pseudomonadota bacterium]